jgi:hypothetical protein
MPLSIAVIAFTEDIAPGYVCQLQLQCPLRAIQSLISDFGPTKVRIGRPGVNSA